MIIVTFIVCLLISTFCLYLILANGSPTFISNTKQTFNGPIRIRSEVKSWGFSVLFGSILAAVSVSLDAMVEKFAYENFDYVSSIIMLTLIVITLIMSTRKIYGVFKKKTSQKITPSVDTSINDWESQRIQGIQYDGNSTFKIKRQGLYLLQANVEFDADSDGDRHAFFLINKHLRFSEVSNVSRLDSKLAARFNFGAAIQLNAGDIIELVVSHSSTSDLNVSSDMIFSVIKL